MAKFKFNKAANREILELVNSDDIREAMVYNISNNNDDTVFVQKLQRLDNNLQVPWDDNAGR